MQPAAWSKRTNSIKRAAAWGFLEAGFRKKIHCSGCHCQRGFSQQKQSYLELSKCNVPAPKCPAVSELLFSFWDFHP